MGQYSSITKVISSIGQVGDDYSFIIFYSKNTNGSLQMIVKTSVPFQHERPCIASRFPIILLTIGRPSKAFGNDMILEFLQCHHCPQNPHTCNYDIFYLKRKKEKLTNPIESYRDFSFCYRKVAFNTHQERSSHPLLRPRICRGMRCTYWIRKVKFHSAGLKRSLASFSSYLRTQLRLYYKEIILLIMWSSTL